MTTHHSEPAREPVVAPAGWKLVPIEPTWGLDAMSWAGAECIPAAIGKGAAGQMACDIYKAMVAAAPPPAPESAQVQEAVQRLAGVLCDPEGRACISGSDGDRAEIEATLSLLKGAAR